VGRRLSQKQRATARAAAGLWPSSTSRCSQVLWAWALTQTPAGSPGHGAERHLGLGPLVPAAKGAPAQNTAPLHERSVAEPPPPVLPAEHAAIPAASRAPCHDASARACSFNQSDCDFLIEPSRSSSTSQIDQPAQAGSFGSNSASCEFAQPPCLTQPSSQTQTLPAWDMPSGTSLTP